MAFSNSSGTIRSAVAGAIALSASALASADPLPAAANFYISGSTAMDNPLRTLFLSNNATSLCQAGDTPDVYTDATSNSSTGGHQFMVVCKLRNAIGTLTAGTVVSVDKESNGGSFEGIKPVAENTTLTFLNVAAIACTGASGAGGGLPNPIVPGATIVAYTHHFGCATTAVAPTIGVADEDPGIFNIATGHAPVTAADIAAINFTQWAQNEFGVAVSLYMYRALQRQQGLTATSDTIANMPSLSSQAIRAIYQGNLISWANLTNAAGVAINNMANLGGGAAVGNQVFICRRGNTSGTNASMDIRFLGQRCTKSEASSNPMTASTTTVAHCSGLIVSPNEYGCAWSRANNIADTVFAGFGGGDVAKCLNDHDRIDQFAIGNLTTNQAFGDAGGAGGSGDADSSNSTNTHFRFVRIDGASPDNGSIVNGSYDFVFDNIMVVSKAAPAEHAALGTALVNDFVSNPATVQALMGTQVGGDANWTFGPMLDQNQPTVLLNGAPLPNTQPPYASGAAVKSGAGAVTPVSPWTFLLVNTSQPQNCAPSAAVPGPGFTTTPSD
jgi:hypothetical protein